MWIEVNRDDTYDISKGRIVIAFYVKKMKPWHIRFNRMFAGVTRTIEMCIWENVRRMANAKRNNI